VRGHVRLDGPRSRQEVTVRLPEADVTTVVRTDARGFAEFRFEADLELGGDG
jgi:hypothetical protein